MARNDGTIDREQAQLAEARLRYEIGRLRGILEREQVARRDAQQMVVRHEANIKELDEQVTRLFKDNKNLTIAAQALDKQVTKLLAENATLRAKTSVVEDDNG